MLKTNRKNDYGVGGFDPPHIGHVRMFKEAAQWGNVVGAINSDDWLMRKKGYVFMPLGKNELKSIPRVYNLCM